MSVRTLLVYTYMYITCTPRLDQVGGCPWRICLADNGWPCHALPTIRDKAGAPISTLLGAWRVPLQSLSPWARGQLAVQRGQAALFPLLGRCATLSFPLPSTLKYLYTVSTGYRYVPLMEECVWYILSTHTIAAIPSSPTLSVCVVCVSLSPSAHMESAYNCCLCFLASGAGSFICIRVPSLIYLPAPRRRN